MLKKEEKHEWLNPATMILSRLNRETILLNFWKFLQKKRGKRIFKDLLGFLNKMNEVMIAQRGAQLVLASFLVKLGKNKLSMTLTLTMSMKFYGSLTKIRS